MIVLLHCFEDSRFFDQVALELEEVHLVKEGLWGLELGSHQDLELAQVKDLVGLFHKRSRQTIIFLFGKKISGFINSVFPQDIVPNILIR